MKRLLSPDFWVGVFTCLAGIGVIMAVTGQVLDRPWIKTTGIALIAPILLFGVALIVI
jgi:hypothetical protein